MTEQENFPLSDLLGMFDKRRFRKLLLFIQNFNERNPRTYQDIDPHKTTTRDLLSRFDLGLDVMEFTGHAIALHNNDRSVTATYRPDSNHSNQIFFFKLAMRHSLLSW